MRYTIQPKEWCDNITDCARNLLLQSAMLAQCRERYRLTDTYIALQRLCNAAAADCIFIRERFVLVGYLGSLYGKF